MVPGWQCMSWSMNFQASGALLPVLRAAGITQSDTVQGSGCSQHMLAPVSHGAEGNWGRKHPDLSKRSPWCSQPAAQCPQDGLEMQFNSLQVLQLPHISLWPQPGLGPGLVLITNSCTSALNDDILGFWYVALNLTSVCLLYKCKFPFPLCIWNLEILSGLERKTYGC